MGGGSKGSADSSGMMEAMVAAQEADKMYQLGEQQFQWSKDVWNQQQPLVTASEQAQINYANQMTAEAQQQWQQYQQVYAPLEQAFASSAANWASPQALATARAGAMGSVASQGMSGINSAAQQLRSYGVDPSSPRYASLFASAQPMLGAAEAAAGTSAAQNLRMQQMALEGQAIQTGRNLVGSTGQLAGVGESGASGAGGTASQNLAGTAVGAGASSQLFNAGSNAMNTYVNAVNGYNQAQAEYAQAGASEMGGFGSALGSIMGMGMMPGGFFRGAKGGVVQRFQDGGMVADGGPSDPQLTPNQGGGQSGIPSAPIPPGGTPGGAVPVHASPSNGVQTDDVPAQLTAGEFVIPKDVASWKGHEYFAKQIDAARNSAQQFAQRDDIGGEPTGAIPQAPNFISRPAVGHPGAIPGGIPMQPMMVGVG